MRDPFHPQPSQPNFLDISALVDKFKDVLGALIKTRTDLAGNVPDRFVNFLDISAAVDAFQGMPYPFAGPQGCP